MFKRTSSASAALWYDYHQTRKKKKKRKTISTRVRKKWVTLALQIGVTSHAHAYTWNQIAVKSLHWGQSTALEAHTQRAFTVHACTAIHRDTNYNEQIWSGVGSCPSKLAHHTKKKKKKNTRAFQTETNAHRFTRWKGQVATCIASEMQC